MHLPVVTAAGVGSSISTSSSLPLLELSSSEEESLSDDGSLACCAFFNVGFGGVSDSDSEPSELELDSSSDEPAGLGTFLTCWAFGLSSSEELSSLSWELLSGAAFGAVWVFVIAAGPSPVSSSLLSSSLLLSDSAGFD